jgi:hypothetical protein
MSMRGKLGGEGASTPWLRAEPTREPALVVFPMAPSAACTDALMVQEIYRLAYERARAAMRPTPYEVARRICWN